MCEFCKHHCWVGINYCPKCGRKANRMSDNLDKIITNVIEAEKNGVKIIIKQQYDREINDINIDFSEHDKVFEDKIAKLEKKNKDLESCFTQREQDSTDMIMELKQRIAELESRETEKQTKINLNDRIKVKLTPLGAEIYYNRYDFLKSSIRAIGGVCTEPKMPKIDENGYTEMTMWQFIELYGKDIGKINREVIKPLDIIIVE